MADIFRSVPKAQQVCPMCGATLPVGALYCEACGTDLSRAGVLFSSSIRPVSRRRWGPGRFMRTAALVAGALAGVLVLLVGLGSLPTVSARVPAILTIIAPIRGAFNQAMEWGTQIVSKGRERPKAPATTPPVAPVTTPTPAPSPFLIVQSTPDGADVYVNAERVGKTPLTLKNLRPGIYTVRVSRKGYASVARKVELQGTSALTVAVRLQPAEGSSAPKPQPAPKPGTRTQAPSQTRPGSQAGVPAPGFALKDRLGVIHRLSDYRGRRVAVLFIWDLDDDSRRAVRSLNARSGGRDALVVLIHPTRVLIRRFVEAEGITIPVLFGDLPLAWEYKVPEGIAVLYLISERGTIQKAEVAGRRQ